jgi:FdhD protein
MRADHYGAESPDLQWDSRVGPSTPTRRLTTSVRVTALRGERHVELPDDLISEEPLEIRAGGPGQVPELVAVTMRTPGQDFELAVGFLHSEGLLSTKDRARSVRYCRPDPGTDQLFNVVTVQMPQTIDMTGRRRAFVVNASCGACGTATLEQLERTCPPVAAGPTVPSSVLVSLPQALRNGQRLFQRTGALHAAGLYSPEGHPLAIREDVGRHNAVDKLVGWASLHELLPLRECILVVSGRVSFEIVQKAAVAGIPILVAVSAPSDLAIATAARLRMTVVGFARGDRANVYCGLDRVLLGRF